VAHLDLEYATLACPVLLEDCRLGSVNLEQATAVEVRLVRCRVQAF
jgi:hypothetical protein